MLVFNSERNRCMGFTKNDILTGLKTWLKELCTIKDYRDVVYIIISIGVLCMVSISYSLKFDESVRQIEVLTQEVKDLRYQSMTMSSKYMNEAKQSRVIQQVQAERLGLEELTEAPRIIYDD